MTAWTGRCVMCDGEVETYHGGAVCDGCLFPKPRPLVFDRGIEILLAVCIVGVVVVAVLAISGCASRPPRVVPPLPFEVKPFDNKPLPWCKAVEFPQPGEACWICLDHPDDKEQIGRGSAEPCIYRAPATWGTPTPKETR